MKILNLSSIQRKEQVSWLISLNTNRIIQQVLKQDTTKAFERKPYTKYTRRFDGFESHYNLTGVFEVVSLQPSSTVISTYIVSTYLSFLLHGVYL